MSISSWNAGIIRPVPVAPAGPYQDGAAPGVWTLDQVAFWRQQGLWPLAGNVPKDAQFNYVTMLLHGNGTNGAQNNTFLDSSTNNFTITRNGNTTQGSFSPYGSNWSANFAASSTTYLSAASNAAFAFGTGDFTMEAFVFATASQTDNWIIGLENNCWFRVSSGGALQFYNSVTSTGTLASTALPLNTWTHVAVVRSGTALTIYQNGVSVGTATVSTNFSSSVACTIGNQVGFDRRWNGYISNARVVKGTAVYTAAFTPSTTPLTAISGTSLLTCQSNRFIDNSSNAFTLTVSGTPSVQRFNPFGTSTAYSTSVIGGSAYFDGDGDNLSYSQQTYSGNFTFECWVYQTGSSGSYPLFFASSNAAVQIMVDYQGTGKLTFYSEGSGIQSASGVFQRNQWNHLAYVRSGSTVTIYYNGISVASGSRSDPVPINFIGGYSSSSYTLNGYMSDVRITTSALYTTTFTPPTAPLTAISGTSLLLNYTNGAIFDNAMMNDLETVGNAQISTSVKKYGTGSMSFDGTGDYLKSPILPQISFNTGDFTVEFWAYLNNNTNAFDFCGTATWASYIGAGLSGWSVSYTNESVSFSYQSNNSFVIATAFSGTTLSTGIWYHVAIVRSSNVIKCYVNGVASATTISSSTNMQSNAYGVWVGTAGNGNANNYYLNGYMDDLRITNGYARYTINFTPPTAAFLDIGPN